MADLKHSPLLSTESRHVSAKRLLGMHEWRALTRRFLQEADELRRALDRGQEHLILDELADVHYFLQHMLAGPIGPVHQAYAAVKGNLRASGIRDKEHELRVAASILENDHVA